MPSRTVLGQVSPGADGFATASDVAGNVGGIATSNGHKTTGLGAGRGGEPHCPRGGTLAGAGRDVDGSSVAVDTRTTSNDGRAPGDFTPTTLHPDFAPSLGAAGSCGHLDGARGPR